MASANDLMGGAALARIAEMGGTMPTDRTTSLERAREEGNAIARSMWALGDYHRFARETVWEVGPVIVDACGIASGLRVLDVAAGSGNVAIRAAEAGASVVASDLTPENLAAGRREADARGLELEWVVADAQALPFADGEFDVVTSSFGAMFAPDHRAVASELLRVCRAGGTIGMASFTPDGLAGAFFGTLVPYLPAPPPDALPPLLWGSEAHVRELLGDASDELVLERRTYVESAATPAAYVELFTMTFGPVIAVRRALADDLERLAAFDADLARFASDANRGTADGPATYPYEYLLVVARKRPA